MTSFDNGEIIGDACYSGMSVAPGSIYRILCTFLSLSLSTDFSLVQIRTESRNKENICSLFYGRVTTVY
jgi:hypothetical protein